MPILVRFIHFSDFYDFHKAVATAFLEISKISTVNFAIHSLSCYLFKNFCPLVTQICTMQSYIQGKTERFFSYAQYCKERQKGAV